VNIPKVNATVVAVRAAWADSEARRAQRKSPGGGRGEPMAGVVRVQNYVFQTDRDYLTPKQLCRFNRKHNRTLRVSTLDGGL
jgi:hypothetical protein